MPVSSRIVNLAARDTIRSTGSRASSRPVMTARAYGVPDAPDTPTTHGVLMPPSPAALCAHFSRFLPRHRLGCAHTAGRSRAEAVHDQVHQGEHEQLDPDET